MFCTNCGRPLDPSTVPVPPPEVVVNAALVAQPGTTINARIKDIREVRSWLKRGLVRALQDDPRIKTHHMKERDYQAIIKQVVESRLTDAYQMRLDHRIAGTEQFADLVIINTADMRCGHIVIEVKPPGSSRDDLVGDVKKLKRYIDRADTTIKLAILLHFSSMDTHDEAVRRAVGDSAKVRAYRVPIPRNRGRVPGT
jgi:hypothetical protein